MHEGKYWLARIPIEHVESAQVGFEEFLPGIYHVFLIFHFSEKNPVVLTSQDQETAKSQKIFNMVISAEGIPPKEGKYNLMDAYMERYIIGLRLMSKEQVIDWSVKKLKHPISLYDLKLDQGQVRKVLLTGLSTGEKNSFQVKYGLFSNNCATNTLDLIDTVVTPEIAGFPIYYKLIYPLARSLPVAGPLGTYHAFWSRDLIQKHPNSVL